MSEPFIAEIRIFGFDFPPRNHALCDGQLLPISQNTALFSLVGTTYGGDGRTTFGLPDLRGRLAAHAGGGSAGPGLTDVRLGQKDGVEAVSLGAAQIPSHSHPMNASTQAGTTNLVAGQVASRSDPSTRFYGAASNLVDTNPAAVTPTGGGQPHENLQPALAVSYCIALLGIFPSRN